MKHFIGKTMSEKKSFDGNNTVTATVNTIFSIFKQPFCFQTHNSTSC